jgi:hypothetical protein
VADTIEMRLKAAYAVERRGYEFGSWGGGGAKLGFRILDHNLAAEEVFVIYFKTYAIAALLERMGHCTSICPK